MGCTCKRPYLCAILALGSTALLLHLAGFVTPGWIIMRKSIREVQMQITKEIILMRANATNNMPPISYLPAEMPGPPPRGPASVDDPETSREASDVNRWILTIAEEVAITDYKIKMSYGLWYSTVCIQRDIAKVSIVNDDNPPDDKKHGPCMKISTRCALSISWIFEDPRDPDIRANLLHERNFGHSSLMEHRLENSVALFFMVLSLIAAIMAFRKPTGCKCVAGCSSLFMLLAAILVIIPAIRLALYSRQKDSQVFPVSVNAPYSIILSGLGAIFAFITAVVASCGAMRIKRAERPGKWYQFHNEMEVEKQTQNEKKPQLVFIAEPLPEKPGLYDACEFGIVMHVESEEPKKVPL